MVASSSQWLDLPVPGVPVMMMLGSVRSIVNNLLVLVVNVGVRANRKRVVGRNNLYMGNEK